MSKHILEMTPKEIEQAIEGYFNNTPVDDIMELLEDAGFFHVFDRAATRARLEQSRESKSIAYWPRDTKFVEYEEDEIQMTLTHKEDTKCLELVC